MYGTWTVYSPTKEVIKSSQGIRNLRANADRTVITHTNQFPSPDGTTLEKQWLIDKQTCNLPDGLLHPANPSKRAVVLVDYGANAWFYKKLETGCSFSVELFLKHEDWNTSIGSIYTETGDLERILYILENSVRFPEMPAMGTEIETLAGNWIGTKQAIAPNLNISQPEEIHELLLDPTVGKNKTFFLPGGVVVNIPEKLKLGEAFEIIAGKFFPPNKYKRLTAKYDNSGTFEQLISEIFDLQD
ncbi:hypothetical protein NIES2098_10730 [Calothrix sp. NIES-2098]|nr:hypothetical protein NIES2098_10730 [Calothrix sp. NIES-2098]